MKRLLSPLLLCLAVSGMLCATATHAAAPAKHNTKASPASTPYAQRDDAVQWAREMAMRQGLPPEWVLAQLRQARYLPQVVRLMTPAPSPGSATTARDWSQYRSRFIDPVRIRAGVQFWNENAEALQRAEAQFGVPASMVVGIIGVETIYGQNMGNLRVLDCLTTLAFDFPTAHPRATERQAYFQGELEQFLRMMYDTQTPSTQPRGSYAGAMGLGQFMPSSWAKWAVDFDHDGRIDLFHSPVDAIGSVARYFQAHGWVSGQPVWFTPAFQTDTLQLSTLLAPDILPSFTTDQMRSLGVIPQGGLDHPGLLALVELRNGTAAPSYVVGTQNFYTITRYNWSSYYAMAVHDLGQEVAAARAGHAPQVAQPTTLPVGAPIPAQAPSEALRIPTPTP